MFRPSGLLDNKNVRIGLIKPRRRGMFRTAVEINANNEPVIKRSKIVRPGIPNSMVKIQNMYFINKVKLPLRRVVDFRNDRPERDIRKSPQSLRLLNSQIMRTLN